tara:strand:+ start:1552 stop:2811 length:1260 start_codon:yes stop_codon:yes gene_type:complete
MGTRKVLILGNVWPYVRGGHRAHPLLINLEKENFYPISISMWNSEEKKPTWPLYEVKERNIFEIIKSNFQISATQESTSDPFNEGFLRGKKNKQLKHYFKDFFEQIICLPDEYWLSKSSIDRTVDMVIEKECPDIILSEFPVIYHFSAYRASKKYNIPWVADFVDLWSQNFNYSFSSLRKFLDTTMESRILSKADALVTVSPVWAKKQEKFNKNSICIEHSFPSILPDKSDLDKLTILYSGRIYPSIQHYEDFFYFIKKNLDLNKNLSDRLEILFVGEGANPQIKQIVKKLKLKDIVSIKERVSHNDIEILKQEANVLMLFATASNQDGWYTSKLFDYLGANKEIWVFGRNKDNIIIDFVEKNKLGKHIEDPETLKTAIDCILEGKAVRLASEEYRENYSARTMSKRFVKLFESVISDR